MAYLTEKYHLIDGDNGMELIVNDIKVKVIDFSLVANLPVIEIFEDKKELVNLGVVSINAFVHVNKGIHNDTERDLLYESIHKLLSIVFNVFHNVFEEDTQVNPNDLFGKSQELNSMLQLVVEMMHCIDIAIYSGLKKMVSTMKYMEEHLDGEENGETIQFLLSMLKDITDSLENNEDKPEYDLNHIKPIGNA